MPGFWTTNNNETNESVQRVLVRKDIKYMFTSLSLSLSLSLRTQLARSLNL